MHEDSWLAFMRAVLAWPRDQGSGLVTDVQVAGPASGDGRKPLNMMFCVQREWDGKLVCLQDPFRDT